MQCNYNSFIQILNFHGLFRNALRCQKNWYLLKTGALTVYMKLITLQNALLSHLLSARYCPLCKNDDSEVVKAGEKLKASKKKARMASATSTSQRDWGKAS